MIKFNQSNFILVLWRWADVLGDGGDRYHDQVCVDAGLVPRGVSHNSAGVVDL